jgi:hypothetical protein
MKMNKTSTKSLHQKYHPKTDDNGPGQYEPNHDAVKERTRAASIHNSPDRFDKMKNEVPDSGEYDPKVENVKYRSPSAIILKKSPYKIEANDDNPGPGHHEHHNNFGENMKSHTIQGKHKQDNPLHENGPGDYEPDHGKVKYKNPSAFISKSPLR